MANRTAISIKVVGLGGSMAAPSRSLAALKLGLAGAREAGATQEFSRLAAPLEDRQPPFLTDKVVGLMSTAGGVYGVQAVNYGV